MADLCFVGPASDTRYSKEHDMQVGAIVEFREGRKPLNYFTEDDCIDIYKQLDDLGIKHKAEYKDIAFYFLTVKACAYYAIKGKMTCFYDLNLSKYNQEYLKSFFEEGYIRGKCVFICSLAEFKNQYIDEEKHILTPLGIYTIDILTANEKHENYLEYFSIAKEKCSEIINKEILETVFDIKTLKIFILYRKIDYFTLKGKQHPIVECKKAIDKLRGN